MRQNAPLGLSAKFGGARSTVVVPMLKDNELVGAFAIYRQEVRPFTEKQIALLENFAAQAVIAIENTRLLSELRESGCSNRPRPPTCSRSSAAATFDLQTVLQTLAEFGNPPLRRRGSPFIFLRKGDLYHVAARHGFSSKFHEYLEQIRARRIDGITTGRTALEAKVIHVSDVMADPEYTWGAPRSTAWRLSHGSGRPSIAGWKSRRGHYRWPDRCSAFHRKAD